MLNIYYMNGLLLWDAVSSDLSTMKNMLYSLKVLLYITPLPLHNGHFLLSPRWLLWRGSTVVIYNTYENIKHLESSESTQVKLQGDCPSLKTPRGSQSNLRVPVRVNDVEGGAKKFVLKRSHPTLAVSYPDYGSWPKPLFGAPPK